MGELTPLCPAGHLPLKGGDWMQRCLAIIYHRMLSRYPLLEAATVLLADLPP